MTNIQTPDNRQTPLAPTAMPIRQIAIPAVRPVVSYIVVGFTIFVFILQFLSLQLLNGDFLAALGDKSNTYIRAGEIWRFATPIFLHASLLHILFNMYALIQIGPLVERFLGRLRFTSIYFLSGIAGVVLSFAFSAYDSLGASGAIFGLIGAWGVFLYRQKSNLGAAGRNAFTNILIIIVLNVAISFTPGIDLWAHFGGLITGSVLAALTGPIYAIQTDPLTGIPRLVDENPSSRILLWIAAVLLLILAAAFAALQWGVV
jgi:rhomboid protease GluP